MNGPATWSDRPTPRRWRDLSFGELCRKAMHRVLKHCRIVFFAAPAAEPGPVSIPGGVQFELASLDVLRRREDFVHPEGRTWALAQARQRMQVGDECYLVLVNGACAGYGWVRLRGEVDIEEVGCRYAVPQDAVVLYDFVIFEEFRRRGLYGCLLAWLRARHGSKRALIYAEGDNAPSLRGIARAGFVPWRELRALRLFGRYLPVAERTLDASSAESS